MIAERQSDIDQLEIFENQFLLLVDKFFNKDFKYKKDAIMIYMADYKIYFTSDVKNYPNNGYQKDGQFITLKLSQEDLDNLKSTTDDIVIDKILHKIKSSFIHEYTHHVDNIISKGQASSNNYETKINVLDGVDDKERELYMNNDQEYNAHLRQVAHETNWSDSFEKIISDTFSRRNNLTYFNKKYRQKFITRMYTTWVSKNS